MTRWEMEQKVNLTSTGQGAGPAGPDSVGSRWPGTLGSAEGARILSTPAGPQTGLRSPRFTRKGRGETSGNKGHLPEAKGGV